MQLRRALVPFCLALALLSPLAAADELTGDVSGAVMLRHNYYLERSTRVIAPEAGIRLDLPSATTIEAAYLIDAITSASLAAGALEDVAFTEVRHDVAARIEQRIDINGNPAAVGALIRRSHEPDYDSLAVSLMARAEMNQRNTAVGFRLNFLEDEVRQTFRGRDNTPTTMDFRERLSGVGFGMTLTQLLSRTVSAGGEYEIVVLDGFTANAYRRVVVAGTPLPEKHPDSRRRHSVAGRLAILFPAIATSLHVHMRLYRDDWKIRAITPELRVYHSLGESAHLRLRYRFYQQSAAFFHLETGEYQIDDPYRTADPKMSAFHSHTLGGQMKIFGRFLEAGRFPRLADLSFDLGFEYIFNTNAYGNGLITQAGMHIPF